EPVEMEEAHRQRAETVRPQRAVGAEFDFLDGVEVDVLHHRRCRARRLGIGCGGKRAGARAQAVEAERPRRPETQAGRARPGTATTAREREQPGAEGETLSSIDANENDPCEAPTRFKTHSAT